MHFLTSFFFGKISTLVVNSYEGMNGPTFEMRSWRLFVHFWGLSRVSGHVIGCHLQKVRITAGSLDLFLRAQISDRMFLCVGRYVLD